MSRPWGVARLERRLATSAAAPGRLRRINVSSGAVGEPAGSWHGGATWTRPERRRRARPHSRWRTERPGALRLHRAGQPPRLPSRIRLQRAEPLRRCPPVVSADDRLLTERWTTGEPEACDKPVQTRVTDRFLGFTCTQALSDAVKCRAFLPPPGSRAFDTSRYFRCVDFAVTDTELGTVFSQDAGVGRAVQDVRLEPVHANCPQCRSTSPAAGSASCLTAFAFPWACSPRSARCGCDRASRRPCASSDWRDRAGSAPTPLPSPRIGLLRQSRQCNLLAQPIRHSLPSRDGAAPRRISARGSQLDVHTRPAS